MELYFCFCNGKRSWAKIFKKGYQHVFVAIKYGEVFVILEDSFQGFFPSMLLEEDFFRFTNLNKCSILKLVQNESAKKKFGIWYWAPTCVNFCKTVGNLRTKAQTPWQLYKHLLKIGAKRWVVTQDKSQDSKPLRKHRPQLQSNKQN